MTRVVIVSSLMIAAMLAAAALRLPTEGARVIERRVAIEAPAMVVGRATPELPRPAPPVPILTPTPAYLDQWGWWQTGALLDTAARADVGDRRPPVDCAWHPREC